MPKKKSAKAAAKKAARLAAAQADEALAASVRTACFDDETKAPRDVLAEWVAFHRYNRNGADVTFEFHTGPGLPDDLKTFVYDLTKANMEELYDGAGWGWQEGHKRRELFHEDARYFIMRRTPSEESKDESGEPVGFIGVRFEMVDKVSALYVYELQLSPAVQRVGLGRHAMQLAELVARKWGMQWIMLTVIKANKPAYGFYTNKMKYVVDETSPSMSIEESEEPYEILSKDLRPPATRAGAGAV